MKNVKTALMNLKILLNPNITAMDKYFLIFKKLFRKKSLYTLVYNGESSDKFELACNSYLKQGYKVQHSDISFLHGEKNIVKVYGIIIFIEKP
jgi:hypothetical protein